MTSGSTFPRRLSRIDSLTLPDHHYLDPTDECYFLGEYTARKGYAFSATNQLVLNFKKSVSHRGTPQYRYKTLAILEAATAHAAAISSEWLNTATLVPVPPSKAMTDPLHDDRLTQMLRAIRGQPPLDIRELVVQAQSTAAAHELQARPTPTGLAQNYRFNPAVAGQPPRLIGIFDDVLTTGAHFKAVQMLLRQHFPYVPTVGIFLARRVPESVDPSDFDIEWPDS